MKPPTPAAAFVCPTMDLNEVTPQLRGRSALYAFIALEIAFSSTGSPAGVPVPWPSTKCNSSGEYPARLYAL